MGERRSGNGHGARERGWPGRGRRAEASGGELGAAHGELTVQGDEEAVRMGGVREAGGGKDLDGDSR